MLPYRSRISVLIFLLPPVILFGGGVLLPIVQSLFLSFFKWDGITNMQFVGFDNYAQMLTADPTFWKAFFNQILYLVICGDDSDGGGSGDRLPAHDHHAWSRGSEGSLPHAGRDLDDRHRTAFPADLLSGSAGPDQQSAESRRLGAADRAWLSDIHTVLAAVSVPEGWRFLGLYTIILYAALLSVPKELEEAAALDGPMPGRSSSRYASPTFGPSGPRRWSWWSPTG